MSYFEAQWIKNILGGLINPAIEEKQDTIIDGQVDILNELVLKADLTDTQPVSMVGAATEANQLLGADWFAQVAEGNIPGHSLVHKFGASLLTTTLSPIAQANTYPTPIANTSLEFISSSAGDSAAGLGGQEITVIGLREIAGEWNEVVQVVETNGTTAVALPIPLIRLYRWYVSRSGTYSSSAASSHIGTLTIRVVGAGATWSQIVTSPTPMGQSQIGVYTIPSGKKAFLLSKSTFVATTKVADLYFFQRSFANDVVAPFSGARRLIEREIGVVGAAGYQPRAPKGPYIGPCDIGFMGLVSVGTADCSVEFELLLVDI